MDKSSDLKMRKELDGAPNIVGTFLISLILGIIVTLWIVLHWDLFCLTALPLLSMTASCMLAIVTVLRLWVRRFSVGLPRVHAKAKPPRVPS